MISGVTGNTREQALESLSNMTSDVQPIGKPEFESRLQRLQSKMRDENIDAIYLHAGTNLYYFTGFRWNPSERMVAAIVLADGDFIYVAPHFELDTLRDFWLIESEIHAWHEHQSPYQLVADYLSQHGIDAGRILIDEVTPFFIFNGLQNACPNVRFEHAQPVTQFFRARKSASELALIQRAHEATVSVIAAAASILEPGMQTTEVVEFIDQAHRKIGAAAGSSFCIVLFGVATSFPHGVKQPQTLQQNDWVLIDTGFLLDGYNSDITRSFCFGEPTDRQREIWDVEKSAQLAAFAAAKLGEPCEVADAAARAVLQSAGLGPDYALPGLPHRTGHGCGLDIHEGPYLVRGESTPLEPGMVFSNEPMIVLPGEFGIRLEDHFYMSDDGPVWFTEPAKCFDDPFG